MQFWKMNGAGNDFILIPDLEEQLPDEALPALARRICERRLSLGADGLMLVRPPRADGDLRMLFYNADGSVGEMCGNGARCICRFGYETGLAPRECQRIETTAGMVTGWRVDERNWRVRLNDPGEVTLSLPVTVGERRLDCAYVVLGDPGIPHACVEIPDLREQPEDDLRELGRALRWHSAFPRGANVNFYELISEDRIFLRTFERGVEDFTYACGTGTGSTVLALVLSGRLRAGADAEMRGGVLHVDVDMEGERIRNLWLTGPTNIVARGELTDEELAAEAAK